MPSRPPTAPRPPWIVKVAAAPFILNTPSTLPTRSTTAIVALAPRACASATACAMTCCTSATVNALGLAASQPPLHPSPPPAPPPHPASRDALTTVSYTHLRAHETRHDLVCRL